MFSLSKAEIPWPRWDGALPNVLFLSYVLILAATHDGVIEPVRAWVTLIVLAGLLLPALAESWRYWFSLAFTLSLNLVPYYAYAANHYWLTVYVTVCFALQKYRAEQGRAPSLNVPRGLLAIVFGFATLQKLLSSYFMSGRLLAYYFMSGSSMYDPLRWLFAGHARRVEAYLDAQTQISNATPLGGLSVSLPAPPEGFLLLCQSIALSIVVAEFVVFAFLVVDRLFDSAFFPPLMLGFVWGTAAFRPEWAFFALVCILVFLARPQLSPWWKLLIVLSAVTLLAFEVPDLEPLL